MARLTTNLKLRISNDLTDDAKYNLRRIDLLGRNNPFSGSGNLLIRAAEDITLQPNSSSVGGSGTGGILNLGDSNQPVELKLNATSIDFSNATLENFTPNFGTATVSTSGGIELIDSGSNYKITMAAPSLSADYSLTLPVDDGGSGQVLSTDGSGNLSWVTVSGAGGASGFADTFTVGDWVGPSGGYYTISYSEATHSLGEHPQVDIFETVGSDYVEVEAEVLHDASGNVTVRIPDVAEARFDGKIIIK